MGVLSFLYGIPFDFWITILEIFDTEIICTGHNFQKTVGMRLFPGPPYYRAAGAFTNEREMHTTGKIYVTKYICIYSGCSTLIEDFKIQLSGIALKITG